MTETRKAIKTLWNWLCILPMAIMLCACPWSDPEEVEPEEVPAPETSNLSDRTVLIYMAARNSLGADNFDEDDLKEMDRAAAAGDFGNSRLLVFRAIYGSEPMMIEITPEGRNVLKTYNDLTDTSVHSTTMQRAILDMQELAPAASYGLILWSHGSGWLQDGKEDGGYLEEDDDDDVYMLKTPQLKSFGQDGSKRMNITTLARVLENCQLDYHINFDYIYFDCCYMMGIEVLYELRNVAPYFVGSVSELPAPGMPYDLNLKYLMPHEPDLVAAAESTFNYYNAMSDPGSKTCTMSVVDASKLNKLAIEVAGMYGAGPTLPSNYSPQKFVHSNCKYFDFEHYLKALQMPQGYEDRKERALAALNDAVIYHAATDYLWKGYYDEVKINAHCGISTYITHSQQDVFNYANYYQLQWYDFAVQFLYIN